MTKALFIAEKPSVAREFSKALKMDMKNRDGYMECDKAIITWCVGHLVTMSYPEIYDMKYKRWSFDTLPFLPEKFRYEVIESAKKQYAIVSSLLNRDDVTCIYVCTDSGREGEYIYRLVEQQAHVTGKMRKRVWIDSQTEEEILRGIREAKDLSEYDNLASAAYLRAKEDYLMGINFSRALTLRYGNVISNFLNTKYSVVSVGRVMTCVLGMVVRREREIREFVKTPFYRVLASLNFFGRDFDGEWRASEGSRYFQSPLLYKENGFKKREDADRLIALLCEKQPYTGVVESVQKKKEKKNAPLLYNLAELQNDCSKYFKISPDETLRIIQELYEKKLVTYPRTDARVLSTAVAKEIHKNIGGLRNYAQVREFADEILAQNSYKNIAKTRYVNDKQITDHYAVIPTGQGFGALGSLNPTAGKVYEIIVRRFLSIFYPPAEFQKVSVVIKTDIKEEPPSTERFYASFRVMLSEGYQKVTHFSFLKEKREREKEQEEGEENQSVDLDFLKLLNQLKKGMEIPIGSFFVKEGETSPPKRYNSGSLILAMENAGQLIEDEELRAQIKGSGIGTSATRAEILKKLIHNQYLSLNKKTQIITPELLGEMIYEVVNASVPPLLNAELTASWEKGLTGVAQGTITEEEYMNKLNSYVSRRTVIVKGLRNEGEMRQKFIAASANYKKKESAKKQGAEKGMKTE
ncbi:type IA DNA topoisomerase [bacterium C-53]|nr:type IA DNA topoisomerase [Lachnospiraceae bacterium]NBI01937.1 type IA DNA topoisomerase [Lachnospiraceae bacterium]RKJ12337.1 type IA DNA topoisomerase [bacterium C-53]